jgi:hypothetical protein
VKNCPRCSPNHGLSKSMHHFSMGKKQTKNVSCFCISPKTGVFLKNQCYDQIFSKSSSSLNKKTPIFSPNFSQKIFF